MIKHLILALLLFAPLSFAASPLYFHTSHFVGSVIGERLINLDGDMPYWGTVGFTLVPSENLDVILEAFHRSNADISANEYELNGVRLGFKYKVCLVNC